MSALTLNDDIDAFVGRLLAQGKIALLDLRMHGDEAADELERQIARVEAEQLVGVPTFGAIYDLLGSLGYETTLKRIGRQEVTG